MATVSMSVAGRSWPPRGQVVLHRGARAGVRGGLLRITRRNADVQRGGEERVLRRVPGEPRWSRLRARESLSEVAAAAPVMASPVLGLPASDGRRWKPGHPSRMIRGPAGGR
jgi:hypothetical protein